MFPNYSLFHNPYHRKNYSYIPKEYNVLKDDISSEKSKKEENIEKRKEVFCDDKLYEPIFEILGIKLYLDDLLIIALLFFLFNEGIDDINIFIALILLLLS